MLCATKFSEFHHPREGGGGVLGYSNDVKVVEVQMKSSC